jgi:hypothetical protein
MKYRKQIACVIAAAIALLFAAYVWPTQWQYFKRGSENLRVNRFTGATEHLTRDGWTEGRY